MPRARAIIPCIRTPYTPAWCAQAVDAHPLGRVLDDLGDLPAALDALA